MNLNYEWYRTFYTVVKEGGFSKAADKLCVTQPAVSQAIRRLEECAGVKLFVRRSGQPIPTEAGRRLFSFIERGVEWFASGENFLGRLSDPNAGEVTVGVSESACRFFILPHIKEMRQRFPDLKLKIKEGNTMAGFIRKELPAVMSLAPRTRRQGCTKKGVPRKLIAELRRTPSKRRLPTLPLAQYHRRGEA